MVIGKNMKTNLKIALVHDYLRDYGGAERVLEALHALYPEAPVYTAFVDKKALGIHWQRFADWDIRTTWLSKIPFIFKIFSPLRVLAAPAFESLDFSEFDVVISSSNAYQAKAVTVPNGVHICYCHTPPRSLYGYSTLTNWRKNPVKRLLGDLINHYMRVVDHKVAQQVDVFIANSQETQKRIQKFYRRGSWIVHPPVVLPDLSSVNTARDTGYYLYVNRLALAKHPELAVTACSNLELPLKVVGTGALLPHLKSIAGPTVEFMGAVDDQMLHELYSGAQALLYPVEDEDFGMVPIEAMGHGVPVLAHRSGGPRETIVDDQTGLFFDELNEVGMQAVIEKFEQKSKTGAFDSLKIAEHAQAYSVQSFESGIQIVVADAVAGKRV